MNENKQKINLIIITSILIFTIVLVGTFAWLTYRTNKTAMVLTLGEINNVQITLSPYQIKANISPQQTYLSDKYTTIKVSNSSATERSFRLYYKIKNIDNELISSNFRFTIERSTDGTTYSQYGTTGNFSSAGTTDEITVLEERIPGNNTIYYYKVYIWLYGQTSSQNNVQGKSFEGELTAQIAKDQYQFVEYLESTGTQSINTGINSSNHIYAEIDMEYTISGNETTSQLILSSQTSAGQWCGQHGGYYSVGTTANFKVSIHSNIRKVLKITYNSSGVQLQIDNETVSRDGNHSTGNNYYIFSSPDLSFYCQAKIYSAKIYDENNVLIRDFVPAYHKSDNTIGLYDVIYDKFYINNGTGTFSKGPNI